MLHRNAIRCVFETIFLNTTEVKDLIRPFRRKGFTIALPIDIAWRESDFHRSAIGDLSSSQATLDQHTLILMASTTQECCLKQECRIGGTACGLSPGQLSHLREFLRVASKALESDPSGPFCAAPESNDKQPAGR